MNEPQKYTGGTDYDAIVADLDKPIGTVRPKGNPDRTHIAGINQARLKMRTGNGDDAHLWPAKRYADMAPNETDRDRRKMRNRVEKVKLERRVNAEVNSGNI
jgi:hypothetical protein